MIEKRDPVPQTAFASVNQSAKWNSRIIENGLLVGLVVIGCAFPVGNISRRVARVPQRADEEGKFAPLWTRCGSLEGERLG